MAEQRGGGGAGLFRARRRGARGEVVGLIGCLRIFGHIRLDDVRDARRRAEEEEPGQQPSAEDRQRGLNENGAENRRVLSPAEVGGQARGGGMMKDGAIAITLR